MSASKGATSSRYQSLYHEFLVIFMWKGDYDDQSDYTTHDTAST